MKNEMKHERIMSILAGAHEIRKHLVHEMAEAARQGNAADTALMWEIALAGALTVASAALSENHNKEAIFARAVACLRSSMADDDSTGIFKLVDAAAEAAKEG